MKKITFILGSMGRGGAERVISILSNSYAERGYQTDIIVLLSNEVSYTLHPTTRIIDYSGNTTSRIRRLPYWLRSIRTYIKENAPAVVVSFAARINLLVMIALWGRKTRLIVSERNDPHHDGRSIVIDGLTKLLYPHAHRVVFQTQRARSHFPALNNAVIIPNPIRVSCPASHTDPNKLVAVGRLTAQKNPGLLIDAFASITQKHPSAYLELYGTGELEAALRAKSRALGMEHKVFFMGDEPDVHTKIADAAVFCSSSNYEGLSNALLEALTMGLTCVSTNCAGADEYIRDGRNGLLVEVGDLAGLASAIDRLLNDYPLRAALGAQAKADSAAFALDLVMAKWDSVIIGEARA